ncbi:TIM barrel protein [Sphingomonas naphthae]|uniref:TIM barrel protein n=1 Tax=Sphingomonas naphthae TaxID=1813468 RepID=A0ABY7TKX1_9SPHN|nr:TIM barrel protein [Sphingomonas naphthae]WCT73613.1 TIM barrel protein [Sphingomonas naphthae]
MHPRLSVHSICFPGAGVEELFGHWRALGAGRVSFSTGQLEGHAPADLRAALAAGGHAVETVTHVFAPGPLSGEAGAIAADRARLTQAIDLAAAIGARSIYMLTGGRGQRTWEEAAALFAEAVAPCLPRARDAGIALAIENTTPFFAHGHLGNTLRDTITLAELAGIGVCIDYFACWAEADIPGQIARAMPRLALVQVSDYVLGDRSLPCRAVPGDGAIPWRQVLRWLLAAGYAGAFDLELLGPRIDAEGHEAAAARAAGVIGALLADLGA